MSELAQLLIWKVTEFYYILMSHKYYYTCKLSN